MRDEASLPLRASEYLRVAEEQGSGLRLSIFLDQAIHMPWFIIGQSSPRGFYLVDPPQLEGLSPCHILFGEFAAMKVGRVRVSARD